MSEDEGGETAAYLVDMEPHFLERGVSGGEFIDFYLFFEDVWLYRLVFS